MTEQAGYRDRFISCTPQGITIRWYYPWGAKHVPYASLRAVQRVEMTPGRGQWRIWGTASPRYWASLDPARPRKDVGLILDVGGTVRPFISPDDPDAFEEALVAFGWSGERSERPGRKPIV